MNCNSYNVAQSLIHTPPIGTFGSGFRFDVFASSFGGRVQRIMVHDTIPKIFYRSKFSDTWNNWEKVVSNTDLDTRLPTYYSLNSVTKIKNLPYGIYNLGNSDILKLTDKPSELAGGRCLLITSGASSYDEKVALILASTHQSGGIYFGHIWGTSVNEFAWKKVIGNA